MNIAIYARNLNNITQQDIQSFVKFIGKHKLKAYIHQNIIQQIKQHSQDLNDLIYPFKVLADIPDSDVLEMIISLGGDGTLLETASLVMNTNVPIMGINFGRLGFLADVGTLQLKESFKAIIDRNYYVEKRMTLSLNTDNTIYNFDNLPIALNDIVIKGHIKASMIKIKTFVNGEYMIDYWADGVIISSPTGSTGYNMSCGGPLTFPDLNCILITPIAPHNLTVRPIIINDNAIVSLEIESRYEDVICFLDNRSYTLKSGTRIAIKKHAQPISLIKLNETSFIHTIKQKLSLGEDKRQ